MERRSGAAVKRFVSATDFGACGDCQYPRVGEWVGPWDTGTRKGWSGATLCRTHQSRT
jgi:hypothetical protein